MMGNMHIIRPKKKSCYKIDLLKIWRCEIWQDENWSEKRKSSNISPVNICFCGIDQTLHNWNSQNKTSLKWCDFYHLFSDELLLRQLPFEVEVHLAAVPSCSSASMPAHCSLSMAPVWSQLRSWTTKREWPKYLHR